jgi:hypothetical protein
MGFKRDRHGLRRESADLACDSKKLIAYSNELRIYSADLIHAVKRASDIAGLRREAAIDPDRISTNPYLRLSNSRWTADLLDMALKVSEADFGNVQLFDPSRQLLKIAEQRGFRREFLDYFENVDCEDPCVCAVAFKRKDRVIVSDVADSPLFSDDEVRNILLRANVRAVQSTPLCAPSGEFLGIVSTHYKDPNNLSLENLPRLDAVIHQFVSDERSHSQEHWA